eukprot:gene12686-15918_t
MEGVVQKEQSLLGAIVAKVADAKLNMLQRSARRRQQMQACGSLLQGGVLADASRRKRVVAGYRAEVDTARHGRSSANCTDLGSAVGKAADAKLNMLQHCARRCQQS